MLCSFCFAVSLSSSLLSGSQDDFSEIPGGIGPVQPGLYSSSVEPGQELALGSPECGDEGESVGSILVHLIVLDDIALLASLREGHNAL